MSGPPELDRATMEEGKSKGGWHGVMDVESVDNQP